MKIKNKRRLLLIIPAVLIILISLYCVLRDRLLHENVANTSGISNVIITEKVREGSHYYIYVISNNDEPGLGQYFKTPVKMELESEDIFYSLITDVEYMNMMIWTSVPLGEGLDQNLLSNSMNTYFGSFDIGFQDYYIKMDEIMKKSEFRDKYCRVTHLESFSKINSIEP